MTDEKRELPKEEAFEEGERVVLPDIFHYRLSERNICVLDLVTLSDNHGTELPRMEVLKADRALRDACGLPYRGGGMIQPWYQLKYQGGATELLSTVTACYSVEIRVLPRQVSLVTEDLKHIRKVLVNGTEISLSSKGKWIDICFDELEIPDEAFVKGPNTITLVMDYYRTSGIEAVYLLGNFGVEVTKDKAVITELPKLLSIGDISKQGLPFYSGSVIYEVDGLDDQCVNVTAEDFGGSLVKLCGKEQKIIAFPPYKAAVEGLCGIEVVLTRRNTFGPLHQTQKKVWAYGPGNFMTSGKDWSEEYMLYEQGLLKTPVVRYRRKG